MTVIVVSVEAVTPHTLSPILTWLSSGVELNLVPVITTLSPAAPIKRGSYMNAHVLLNLLNKLGKSNKM